MVKETSAIRDLDKCPVCGTPLVFIKGMKPTGHIGIMAVHEGNIPVGADVLTYVKESYKKHCADRDMKRAHAGEETKVLTPEPKPVDDVLEEVVEKTVEESPSSTFESTPETKTKVIIRQSYAAEVIPDRKIVDVKGMNHNRFAIIGKVVSTLRDSIPEGQIKAIRSDLMTHGKDLNTLMAVASRYAIIHENGLPFTLESGL